MKRVYNFSAGPSMLPLAVLERAQQEMLDCGGSGMSVMEMSHRSKVFSDIIEGAEAKLRQLMDIPDEYAVLFLQGGASSQFSMVPLNLMGKSKRADYLNTGSWSTKAIAEAKRYGQVREVASSADKNFTYIPEVKSLQWDPEAAYVHMTANNTIYGTMYQDVPETGSLPLVADMSSNILATRCDVRRFALIYAGAQKNIGPAGLTLVIMRRDLIGHALPETPAMFNYKTHDDAGSCYNTPPCFAIYMAGLVFDWLLELGGVDTIEKINRQKADMLYTYLDNSQFFHATVAPPDRSVTNIPFVLRDPSLEGRFLSESAAQGLVTLKGHRSVGGMRASIYNAMPLEGVARLVEFMTQFEKAHG